MTHHIRLLLPALGCAGAIAAAALLARPSLFHPVPGPVYTVTQVVNDALRRPRDWDGRVVRVRAIASVSVLTSFHGGAQQARAAQQILLSPVPGARFVSSGQDGLIRLLAGHEDRALALVRRLPLLGTVVPPPQLVSMTHPETYQIQLHLAAHECNFSPCITAILLDAAPMPDPSAAMPYGL